MERPRLTRHAVLAAGCLWLVAGCDDGGPDGADIVVDSPDLVLIEPGTFTMGSPASELGRDANDEIEHQVTLTSSFYLQETEVTQGQWRSAMGVDPSTFTTCGDDCPADNLTWWDALAYANTLSRVEELPECYTLQGCTGTPGQGLICSGVMVNAALGSPVGCSGYRLPTESEWEYAYRGGTTTAFFNGGITTTDCGIDANLFAIGWYCGNSADVTHRVAQKPANPLGLYDMSGNVYDWCWDWYGAYPGTATDPIGPTTGTDRVLRGGSWGSEVEWSRAAWRHAWEPSSPTPHFGARLARTAP